MIMSDTVYIVAGAILAGKNKVAVGWALGLRLEPLLPCLCTG